MWLLGLGMGLSLILILALVLVLVLILILGMQGVPVLVTMTDFIAKRLSLLLAGRRLSQCLSHPHRRAQGPAALRRRDAIFHDSNPHVIRRRS